MFSTSPGGGGPCAEETNNGHGSTFANKYFQYNTCVNPSPTAPAYTFASCDPADLNDTVWETAGNTFWSPPGATVEVHCKGGSIPLDVWQSKYGQDLGSKVVPLPPTAVVMDAARAVLQI
mmetsp:Transcript_4743/g.14289  ORF Transcript_4743/g.14289 Transcript_4743/m.14289 type:complete len:120 (+) Transcript_4743:134-493(+)